MPLTPPKHFVFWVSVVLAVLGLLGMFGIIIPADLGAWSMLAGYVVLMLGVVLKDF